MSFFHWSLMVALGMFNITLALIYASRHRWGLMIYALLLSFYCIYHRNTSVRPKV